MLCGDGGPAKAKGAASPSPDFLLGPETTSAHRGHITQDAGSEPAASTATETTTLKPRRTNRRGNGVVVLPQTPIHTHTRTHTML